MPCRPRQVRRRTCLHMAALRWVLIEHQRIAMDTSLLAIKLEPLAVPQPGAPHPDPAAIRPLPRPLEVFLHWLEVAALPSAIAVAGGGVGPFSFCDGFSCAVG